MVGVWTWCWWCFAIVDYYNSMGWGLNMVLWQTLHIYFLFFPRQIFLPFGRVLIYLCFWSSGFKLERFYEEWKEGEMMFTFFFFWLFFLYITREKQMKKGESIDLLCMCICRGRRVKFDLQSLRQKTPINHMFKGL